MKAPRVKAFSVFKFALSAALVYLVATKAGMDELTASLGMLTPALGLALLGSLFFTLLKVLKWRGLVQAASGEAVACGDAATSYLVGMAGGLLTPGRVGEVARAFSLERHGRGLVAYLVILDRVFEVAAVVFLALPGIVHFAAFPAGAVAAAVLALLLAVIGRPDLPLRWLGRLLPPSGRLAAARETLGRMGLQAAAIPLGVKFRQSGLALLSYGVAILQFHFLLNNHLPAPLATAMLAQPLIMLTNILPVTIGGLGLREGAAMVLLPAFGVPRAAAVSSAFMLFFLNTALPALAGALLFLFSRGRANR